MGLIPIGEVSKCRAHERNEEGIRYEWYRYAGAPEGGVSVDLNGSEQPC